MRYLFLSEGLSEKKRKRRLALLLGLSGLILLLCAALTLLPTSEDAGVYDKVIRFHVIANSDSEADQTLKLTVRDAVIEKYRGLLSSFSTEEEAEAGIAPLMGQIADFAEETVRGCGADYECTAFFGKEKYARTVYDGLSMPAGEYTSLRIVIGEGKGHNWWCVLFPPMCTRMAIASEPETEDAFVEAGFTKEQYRLITGTDQPKYRIRFRLLEWFFS